MSFQVRRDPLHPGRVRAPGDGQVLLQPRRQAQPQQHEGPLRPPAG
jgi:hypothetical protein